MIKFYLASRSPRRREILKQIGIQPVVVESSVIETTQGESAREHTLRLARMKAESVLPQLDQLQNAVVLGSDTEVSFNGEIFGQPQNDEEARRMLQKLSGATHTVTTSIYLIKLPDRQIAHASEDTSVTFRHLSADDIDNYMKTGEPFDKAGGYGIQSKGALLVEKIDGCYFNVVGLPVSRLAGCLKNLEIDIWDQGSK